MAVFLNLARTLLLLHINLVSSHLSIQNVSRERLIRSPSRAKLILRHVRSEQASHVSQGCEVWEEIRAETGYSSYTEYLNKSAQGRLNFSHYRPSNHLSHRPELSNDEESRDFTCSVIDLSRDEKSTISTSSQDYHGETSRKETATKVLENLRQPPQTASLRVVLWWDNNAGGVPTEMLNVCGLGLKIHPLFFGALSDRADKGSLHDRLQRGLVQPFLPGNPSPNYTIVGNHISTTARDYITGQVDTPPVLLIVGWKDGIHDRTWHDVLGDDSDSITPHSDRCEPDEVSHFQASIVESGPRNHMHIPRKSRFLRSRTYVKILDELLKDSDDAATGNEHLLILSTLPLLHLDTLHMHAKMRSLRHSYIRYIEDTEYADDVKHQRTVLRRHIEDSEMSFKNFERYVHSQEGGDLLRRRDFMRIEELWRDALSQARLLETEVRDNMQLEASQSSLQESRKSIELSNHQIEENRRVKIFTILAFIYVPVTTVTSIYGMNIQQINGSGHSIWIFVVTSIAALLITGSVWYLIEESNKMKASRRDLNKRPKYSLALRLYMVGWLAMNGHLSWMRKSKAWSQILENSDEGFEPTVRRAEPYESEYGSLTACHYVSYHMSPPRPSYADPFSLHELRWGVVQGRRPSFMGQNF